MLSYTTHIIKQTVFITYKIMHLLSLYFLTISIIYISVFHLNNISYTEKFELKTEYYEEEPEQQNGLSLMDPLKHSSGILTQNNIGIDVSKYILEVIAFSPHGTYCLINKKILSVGDILEDENNIKILEIRDDSIEIGNHNFRHTITIHS